LLAVEAEKAKDHWEKQKAAVVQEGKGSLPT
jgi:hypothetical protein